MSLARATDDPTLRQHYEDLALETLRRSVASANPTSPIPHWTLSLTAATPASTNTLANEVRRLTADQGSGKRRAGIRDEARLEKPKQLRRQ